MGRCSLLSFKQVIEISGILPSGQEATFPAEFLQLFLYSIFLTSNFGEDFIAN